MSDFESASSIYFEGLVIFRVKVDCLLRGHGCSKVGSFGGNCSLVDMAVLVFHYDEAREVRKSAILLALHKSNSKTVAVRVDHKYIFLGVGVKFHKIFVFMLSDVV
jgi:hypothetical protein